MLDILIAAQIGMPHEPAGIVLMQRHEELTDEFDKVRRRWRARTTYTVPQIERLPGGARLGDVVEVVERLWQDSLATSETPPSESSKTPPSATSEARHALLVNVTFCGRPIVELMIEREMRPIPILTTQSDSARRGRGVIHVPAKELISSLGIMFGKRQMRVDKGAANADVLAKQLGEFRAKPKPKGPSEPWSEAETGELVMALALAGYWGEHRLSSILRQPPPPRVPIDPAPPLTFDQALKLARKGATRRERI